MRLAVCYLALASLAAVPCIVLAAHRLPGQWQVTVTSRFSQGGPQIPPQLRAQLEARGMKLPGSGEPHTYKTCLTPADAAKDQPDISKHGTCQLSHAAWSGNHYHADISCHQAGGDMHGAVDGEVSDGGRRASSTAHMEGANPQLGGHFVMESLASAQWLGPTCSKDTD